MTKYEEIKKKYREAEAKREAKKLQKLRTERITQTGKATRKALIDKEKAEIRKAKRIQTAGRREKLRKAQTAITKASRSIGSTARKVSAAQTRKLARRNQAPALQFGFGGGGQFPDLLGIQKPRGKKQKPIKWF